MLYNHVKPDGKLPRAAKLQISRGFFRCLGWV
jgi:hypothetical protein